jgi:hypothetical protein
MACLAGPSFQLSSTASVMNTALPAALALADAARRCLVHQILLSGGRPQGRGETRERPSSGWPATEQSCPLPPPGHHPAGMRKAPAAQEPCSSQVRDGDGRPVAAAVQASPARGARIPVIGARSCRWWCRRCRWGRRNLGPTPVDLFEGQVVISHDRSLPEGRRGAYASVRPSPGGVRPSARRPSLRPGSRPRSAIRPGPAASWPARAARPASPSPRR